MQFFKKFLVSVINPYYINGLHLFLDSFEWLCLQVINDENILPLLSKALW